MKLSSPILIFLFASAGVHGGLVMTANNSSTITPPASEGSVFSVKIDQQKLVSKNKPNKTQSSNTASNKTAYSLSKKTEFSSNQPSSELTQATYASQQAESKARVISIVYKKLSQHFVYPKLAQRRNWQGKVLLSLRVTSNGEIDSIHVSQSSGYAILDQAALNSLSKVGYLPQISSWLPYDINLKLPVIYQLTEG